MIAGPHTLLGKKWAKHKMAKYEAFNGLNKKIFGQKMSKI